MFCKMCGKQIADDAAFCNSCGAKTVAEATPPPQPVAPPPVQPTPPPQYTTPPQQPVPPYQTAPGFDPANYNEKADAEANKAMAVLAYFIFFLPLVAAKDSKFARYHANQGLILLMAGVALWILQSIILAVSWRLYFTISFVFMLVGLAVGVLGILGIVNAVKGEKKPMPLIGQLFTIIK